MQMQTRALAMLLGVSLAGAGVGFDVARKRTS